MEQLLVALNVIRDECRQHTTCDTCPIGDEVEASCMLQSKKPYELKLVDDIPIIRLIKE